MSYSVRGGDDVGQWVAEKTGGCFRPDAAAIGLLDGDKVVAGAIYDNVITGASCTAHIAAEYMNRQWLHMIHWYPFCQLGVRCVIGSVSTANEKALRFDQHLGFKEVARIPAACVDGDMVILVLTKEDARYGNVQ